MTVKGKEVPLYDDAYMRPVARLREDAPGNWFSPKFACLDPKDGGQRVKSDPDLEIIERDPTHPDTDEEWELPAKPADGSGEVVIEVEDSDSDSDSDSDLEEMEDDEVEVVCGEGSNFRAWGFYQARGELPPAPLVRVKQEDGLPLVRVKQEDGLERAEEEGDSASPRQRLTATHPAPPSVVDLTMDDEE